MMNMMNKDEYDGSRNADSVLMKVCPSCLLEYEASSEDQKICFSCFKKGTGQREIARDEIIVDIDNPDEWGCRCVSAVGIGLFEAGYHFQLWYADGQKQPHIHIKGIPHIAELPDSQLKQYKRLFLQRYVPKEFWNEKIPDYSLCEKGHLIAEENKPHFKYKTLKTLRSEFNEDKDNFAEIDLYDQATQATVSSEYKPIVNRSGITAKIIQAIDIRDIAKQFGLNLHRNKCSCPFHADGKSPSLVFYEKQGRFHCFGAGCEADGNIIKFYAMLKALKPDFIYKKPLEATA